jgi:hypothetical protein
MCARSTELSTHYSALEPFPHFDLFYDFGIFSRPSWAAKFNFAGAASARARTRWLINHGPRASCCGGKKLFHFCPKVEPDTALNEPLICGFINRAEQAAAVLFLHETRSFEARFVPFLSPTGWRRRQSRAAKKKQILIDCVVHLSTFLGLFWRESEQKKSFFSIHGAVPWRGE